MTTLNDFPWAAATRLGLAAAVAAGSLAYAFASRRPPDPAPALTTLIVVRHADRDGEKDALTEAGAARARELARVAAEAGVAAVYVTPTERARKTAEPLATARNLKPVLVAPLDAAGVVRRALDDNRGGVVLIVAHSNTVPRIIKAAGGPTMGDLDESVFDDLFVVTVPSEKETATKLLRLKYGARTP